jgi:hypothetical protein
VCAQVIGAGVDTDETRRNGGTLTPVRAQVIAAAGS